MTTSTTLSDDLLAEHGIDYVDVTVHICRVPSESYHLAEGVEIETVHYFGKEPHFDQLEGLAQSKGYDEPEIFLFERFQEHLNEVAMEDGPQIEADSYSSYMDQRFHEQRVEI